MRGLYLNHATEKFSLVKHHLAFVIRINVFTIPIVRTLNNFVRLPISQIVTIMPAKNSANSRPARVSKATAKATIRKVTQSSRQGRSRAPSPAPRDNVPNQRSPSPDSSHSPLPSPDPSHQEKLATLIDMLPDLQGYEERF